MGIGDLQIFEDALDRAVLAVGPVQRVEGDVRRDLSKPLGDIPADIEARDGMTDRLERVGAGIPRGETDRSLRGESAHQDRNMLGHRACRPH